MKTWLASWMRSAMALSLYLTGGLAAAEDLARFPADSAATLPPAVQIASCSAGFAEAADGDLRRLHRGWLLAGGQGLLGVAADGTVVAQLAPGLPCRAVATLPRGPRPTPAEAFRLAYWTTGGLFAVGSDGTHRELAAGAGSNGGPGWGERSQRRGPGGGRASGADRQPRGPDPPRQPLGSAGLVPPRTSRSGRAFPHGAGIVMPRSPSKRV